MKNRPSKITWTNYKVHDTCGNVHWESKCNEHPIDLCVMRNHQIIDLGYLNMCNLATHELYVKSTGQVIEGKPLKKVELKRLAIRAWQKLVKDGMVEENGRDLEWGVNMLLCDDMELLYYRTDIYHSLYTSPSPMPMEEVVNCSCCAVIPPDNIEHDNRCNEDGEEWAEVKAICPRCKSEWETSKWGSWESRREALLCIDSYISGQNIIHGT